jgi:small-conductance mechanosensitive channel
MQSFEHQFVNIFTAAWHKAPELIVTFVVGYLLIKIVSLILHGVIKVTRTNQALKGILMSVIDIGLWLFLISALLEQMGFSQLALALSGTTVIAALAISSGSSVFVQDLVAGLFLAQDPDFRVGDRLKIDVLEGIIERMDARKVRMRDDDGLLHVYPNSMFDKSAWVVIKKKSRE